MAKKVLVLFRGSIGDACVWMPKLKGLFDRHKSDDIYFIFNSRYDKEFTLSIFRKNSPFMNYWCLNEDKITSIPYHMPSKVNSIRANFGPHDYFYNFDVWGNEAWNPPVAEMYRELGYDVYPVKLDNKREKTIIIHPYGYYIKNTWTPQKWLRLRGLYEQAGYKVVLCGDTKEHFFNINDLIEMIRTASLWIGVDTGTRNIALIYQTPVIELGTPGKGDPNLAVFTPVEYRHNSIYAPNIDLMTPDQIFNKSKEMMWV
jgi:ADP-heptose:LPS heptosyltransferase